MSCQTTIKFKCVFMVALARYAHRCADVQSANIADAVALLLATLRRQPVSSLTHWHIVHCSDLFDQHHGISRNALFATCEAKLFGGSGFNADIVCADVHNWRQAFFHGLHVWVDFWAFCTYCSIDVAHLPPIGLEYVDGLCQ